MRKERISPMYLFVALVAFQAASVYSIPSSDEYTLGKATNSDIINTITRYVSEKPKRMDPLKDLVRYLGQKFYFEGFLTPSNTTVHKAQKMQLAESGYEINYEGFYDQSNETLRLKIYTSIQFHFSNSISGETFLHNAVNIVGTIASCDLVRDREGSYVVNMSIIDCKIRVDPDY